MSEKFAPIQTEKRVGKPGNTNPIRKIVCLCMEACDSSACLSAATVLAVCLAASALAQTQAALTPLVLPSAIAFDSQGNLYFAETGSHIIRELSTNGVITTVAGTGVQGFSGDHGLAIAAELDSPAGLALDAEGNLYISDTHNHRVREVAVATGNITTIAGNGVRGFSGDGTTAISAELDLPTSLAIDADGNVYVADTNNHRVRRIAAATGIITTAAGNGVEGFSGDNGLATAASIDSPNGLAIDSANNLFVCDTHNHRVRKVIAVTGIITTIVGKGSFQAFGGDGGQATAASLALPRGLTIDAAGNLYIADSANHRIRRVSTSGTISTVAGQGTETFAGNEAPAITASLDTPRSVAISPAGLLTLSDSHNQQIRQLDALPPPGPDIHTIAGVSGTVSGTLVLSGPSVVTYGNGTLSATLGSTALATGDVAFLDSESGAPITLGTTAVGANSASFSTAALPAGSHAIFAVYAGDATHVAARSSTLALTIVPLSITSLASSTSILFGQPVPALSGILSGVLSQDTGKVAAIFTTGASLLSPVGLYPIGSTLTGSAAANYTAIDTPAELSIDQAPTLTELSPSTSTPDLGQPVLLSMQAASTTSGVPTGLITVMDGATVLSVDQLAVGLVTFSTNTLGPGAHTLSAVYSGDTNFLPSTSAISALTVGTASDFTLTATGATSQAVPAGSAATFKFSVAMQGASVTSPILLAVQGTPIGATASLSPSYLPPGGTVTSFTLTIQTPLAASEVPSRPNSPSGPNVPGSILLSLLLISARCHTRRPPLQRWRGLALLFVAAACMLAAGCGDRVNTTADTDSAKIYILNVTATATGSGGTALQHSANVTLKVL